MKPEALIAQAIAARRVKLATIAKRAGVSKAYASMLLRGQRTNAAARDRVLKAFHDLLTSSPLPLAPSL